MNPAMRTLIWLHRYLGVAVGLLMTLWCLSGVVMMYVSYPELTDGERLKGFLPLTATAVATEAADPAASVASFSMEMLAGTPVAHLQIAGRPSRVLDAATGREVGFVDGPTALTVARVYGGRHGISHEPRLLERIDRDQWTVAGGFRRHGPLHHIGFDDAAGSEIYISSRTGEVVQDTTRRERFWNWLGAVPHWLYPTLLRENVKLWTQVVIWTSLLGVFLTVAGLTIGIVRFRRRASGRWTPYRGLLEWHHWTGLLGGILVLSWVLSGLASMNPWGFLEGSGGGRVRAAVSGSPPSWAEVSAAAKAALARLPPEAVTLRMVPLNGRLFLVATNAEGEQTRLDDTGAVAPPSRAEFAQAASAISSEAARSLSLIDREDAYYYAHHDSVRLPVWRTVDAEQRLYFDPESGALLRRIDADGRWYRWLHRGLHSLDFSFMRARPIWDLIVLPLLLAAALTCALGAWLGLRRIKRDIQGMRRP